jgi:hypothetical protein
VDHGVHRQPKHQPPAYAHVETFDGAAVRELAVGFLSTALLVLVPHRQYLHLLVLVRSFGYSCFHHPQTSLRKGDVKRQTSKKTYAFVQTS